MAIIPQMSMFVWENEIESLGDLIRLELVLESLPDEKVMRVLREERGNWRNDYPICAMWNLLIAMSALFIGLGIVGTLSTKKRKEEEAK